MSITFGATFRLHHYITVIYISGSTYIHRRIRIVILKVLLILREKEAKEHLEDLLSAANVLPSFFLESTLLEM